MNKKEFKEKAEVVKKILNEKLCINVDKVVKRGDNTLIYKLSKSYKPLSKSEKQILDNWFNVDKKKKKKNK